MISLNTVKTAKLKKFKYSMYTVKKLLKPMLSQYLGNEKRYRKNLCGFEILEKR